MSDVAILDAETLRRAVPLDREAIACVREAFVALATQAVSMPPVLRLDVPEHNGEVDVKTAYVPGMDSFAIKVSPGFFDNPKRGLPSLNGLMLAFSAETGLVKAVLLDEGWLTDLRTAAAGAVAADALARPDASTATILGTGTQARLQLRALALVRDLRAATIWGRRPDTAEALAAEMTAALGIPVRAETDARTACAAGDVIVTTTPSRTPLIEAGWLRPGQHVTAMGSDSEHKSELAPAVVAEDADVFACDRLSQSRVLGELRAAIAAGAVAADAAFPELGEIVAGRVPGRTDPAQVTVCDLTGTGVQDTAIAAFALRRCGAAPGAGAAQVAGGR